MPNRADAYAAAFVGDLGAKGGALVPICAEEPELHQFVRAEQFLQLGEKLRRESAPPDLESGFELLACAAQKRLLRTGERKLIHGGERSEFSHRSNPFNAERADDQSILRSLRVLRVEKIGENMTSFWCSTNLECSEGIQRQLPPFSRIQIS